MLIPWSTFWDRNYFAEWSVVLGSVMNSSYTRGAVTGLGLINVWAALGELVDVLGSRRSGDPQSQIDPHPEIPNRQ